MQDDFEKQLWFLSRWTAIFIVHVILVIMSFYTSKVTYDVVSLVGRANPELIGGSSLRFVAAISAASIFFASMAGTWWVKQMSIVHFLPEILDSIEQKIRKS